MNHIFCQAVAYCFQLEELDLTGDVNVGDEGILVLPKGDIKLENN